MSSEPSRSEKSLEEQIEERIRRDQAILQSGDASLAPDGLGGSGGGSGQDDDENSGCRFPLAVLLAISLTLCLAATALAHLL